VDRKPSRDYWEEQAEELSRTSLKRIRETATAWAATITALLGIFGTVAIIQGPDTIADFSGGTQTFLIVIIAIAVGLAISAVITTELAAQGVPKKLRPLTGRKLARWHVDESDRAATLLAWGRDLAIAAAALIFVAGVVAMAATALKPGTDPVMLVRTADGRIECGSLGREGGTLVLRGTEDEQLLDLSSDIAEATFVDDCPSESS
jgi:hypothetical protein